jgi:hypothetical protein
MTDAQYRDQQDGLIRELLTILIVVLGANVYELPQDVRDRADALIKLARCRT